MVIQVLYYDISENEKKKPRLKTREKKSINFTDFSYILHFLLKIKLIYLNSRGAFFGFGLMDFQKLSCHIFTVKLTNFFNTIVDPNQELIAMGASNIFGTFFQSLPMTASMSRTMVQVSAGGRTLMASVVSIFMLLWVNNFQFHEKKTFFLQFHEIFSGPFICWTFIQRFA